VLGARITVAPGAEPVVGRDRRRNECADRARDTTTDADPRSCRGGLPDRFPADGAPVRRGGPGLLRGRRRHDPRLAGSAARNRLGAAVPYRIPEPGAIWSLGPGGDEMCAGDGVYCNWFFVYSAPDSELEIGAEHRWVAVTGHRMDPAAEGCYWDYGDGEVPAETNNPEIARSDCRTRFVLTGIADAPD
jgi:hypothetical protein